MNVGAEDSRRSGFRIGSRRWFTRPVMNANKRTHLSFRIVNQHGTGVVPALGASILTKRDSGITLTVPNLHPYN